jgi:lysophospholipase L1-like esterase
MPRSTLLIGIVLGVLTGCSGGGGGGDSSPVANADTFAVAAPAGSVSGNVLTNDNPSTGLVAELVTGPTSCAGCPGSFSLNSNGSFTFTHNGNAQPTDSFTYRTKVGAITSNTTTVTININQPPVAQNVCPSIANSDTFVNINPGPFLLGSDPNGTAPTYEVVTGAANGTVTPNAQGGFTYVPSSNSTGRRGMDKFTFRARDASNPSLVSQPATVTILKDGKVRIMPLGDSITEGITDGTNDKPDPGFRVGYRKKLHDDLLAAGYPIDFVGSQNEGVSAGLADPDHEGHPGWCDDNNPICTASGPGNPTIADYVQSFLNTSPPDILLLHIGTNEFTTDATGVNTILNNISNWAQQNYPVKVYLARIIPSLNAILGDVQAFNDNVDAIAGNRLGVTVHRVNQQGELQVGTTGSDRNMAQPALMADDYHPNDTGYGKIADRWKADLLSNGAMPACP